MHWDMLIGIGFIAWCVASSIINAIGVLTMNMNDNFHSRSNTIHLDQNVEHQLRGVTHELRVISSEIKELRESKENWEIVQNHNEIENNNG